MNLSFAWKISNKGAHAPHTLYFPNDIFIAALQSSA